MRKLLCFFLWVVISIFTSISAKAIDVKDNVPFSGIKKPVVRPQSIPQDSLKAPQKNVVYHEKHRLVAALLAFPLGVLGLHRIYLHTSIKVPLIYIITAGGLFGVLPFIDFVLILLNKDLHLNYTSNPHLFMWQKR